MIAQSIPAGRRDAAEAEAVTAAVAAAAGAPATWDGLAALPPEALLAVQDAPLTGRGSGLTAFGPVVDGDLVTGPPGSAVREDVDLVCGFTHDEYQGIGGPPPPGADLDAVARTLGLPAASAYRRAHPGGTDAALFTVMLSDALIRMPTTRAAEAHVRRGGRAWMCDFAWQSPAAGHGIDVPFVFGTGGTRYAARFLGSPPHPGFGPLAERIRAAWTAFAATGDPGRAELTPTMAPASSPSHFFRHRTVKRNARSIATIPTVGRHAIGPEPTAHRSAGTVKILGAIVIACVLALGLYLVLSKGGSGSATARPTPPPALSIKVTGAQCLVFVRRPGGEVLVNQTLTAGQSVHFDGPPFDVVLGDATAAAVYVRGRLRPAGPTSFTVS